LSKIVSLSPCQAAIAACGSIGLWCSMGMRNSASIFTGAFRIASSGLPRGFAGVPREGMRARPRTVSVSVTCCSAL
jgi:hypothetical protein